MRFLSKKAKYPKDRDLVRVLNAATSRVHDRLLSLDTETLDVSATTKRVLRVQPEMLSSHIHRCAHVFAWALPSDDTPFSDLSLVAFGDGLGVLSLLAKECSIGSVVYTDADDVLCRDARIIAKTIGSRADHYVCGDIEDVQFYVKRNSISCDVFVSCDGIERVDEPRAFFDTLHDLSDTDFSFGLAERTNNAPDESQRRGQPADPYTLRNEMTRAGFRVELLNGRRVGPPEGAAETCRRADPSSIGPFLGRFVNLAAVFAHRRPSRTRTGLSGSIVLFGNRQPEVCGHPQPVRNPRTVVSPLRTGEVLVS